MTIKLENIYSEEKMIKCAEKESDGGGCIAWD